MDKSDKGNLGIGQLIISWDYDFPSSCEAYSYDDRNGLVCLTNNGTYGWIDGHPSPNGQYMLVTYQYADLGWIALANADMNNSQHLANVPSLGSAQWSPNSKYFACVSYPPFTEQKNDPIAWLRRSTFYIYNLNTNTLSKPEMPPFWKFFWTPDNDLLIVSNETDKAIRLLKFDVNGVLIEDLGEWAFDGKISPDCQRMAFIKRRHHPNKEDLVYIAKLDGTDAQLVGEFTIDSFLSWSPDSKHLAFVEPTLKLIITNVNGDRRELVNVSRNDANGVLTASVAWSPDGKQLVAASEIMINEEYGETEYGLFAVNVDGTNLRQIHEARGLIYDVKWRL